MFHIQFIFHAIIRLKFRTQQAVVILSLLVLFVGVSILPTIAQTTKTDFTSFVDPHIGTAHCRWFHFTPGALPFGMAKPAPSTNGSYGNAHGWDATGYDYRHTS